MNIADWLLASLIVAGFWFWSTQRTGESMTVKAHKYYPGEAVIFSGIYHTNAEPRGFDERTGEPLYSVALPYCIAIIPEKELEPDNSQGKEV